MRLSDIKNKDKGVQTKLKGFCSDEEKSYYIDKDIEDSGYYYEKEL